MVDKPGTLYKKDGETYTEITFNDNGTLANYTDGDTLVWRYKEFKVGLAGNDSFKIDKEGVVKRLKLEKTETEMTVIDSNNKSKIIPRVRSMVATRKLKTNPKLKRDKSQTAAFNPDDFGIIIPENPDDPVESLTTEEQAAVGENFIETDFVELVQGGYGKFTIEKGASNAVSRKLISDGNETGKIQMKEKNGSGSWRLSDNISILPEVEYLIRPEGNTQVESTRVMRVFEGSTIVSIENFCIEYESLQIGGASLLAAESRNGPFYWYNPSDVEPTSWTYTYQSGTMPSVGQLLWYDTDRKVTVESVSGTEITVTGDVTTNYLGGAGNTKGYSSSDGFASASGQIFDIREISRFPIQTKTSKQHEIITSLSRSSSSSTMVTWTMTNTNSPAQRAMKFLGMSTLRKPDISFHCIRH